MVHLIANMGLNPRMKGHLKEKAFIFKKIELMKIPWNLFPL